MFDLKHLAPVACFDSREPGGVLGVAMSADSARWLFDRTPECSRAGVLCVEPPRSLLAQSPAEALAFFDPASLERGRRFRHWTRGSEYQLECADARVQFSGNRKIEQALTDVPLAVYRDVLTSRWFVRPTAEFLDGRFVEVTK